MKTEEILIGHLKPGDKILNVNNEPVKVVNIHRAWGENVFVDVKPDTTKGLDGVYNYRDVVLRVIEPAVQRSRE